MHSLEKALLDFRLESLPPQPSWLSFLGSCFNLLGQKTLTPIVVDNAKILGSSSIILDSRYQLILEALNEHLYWNPCPFPFAKTKDPSIRSRLISERLDYHEELASNLKSKSDAMHFHHSGLHIFLCHPFGWYAYGHLHDTLQRLYSLPRDLLQESKFVISKPNRVVDFWDHLSIFAGFRVCSDRCVAIASNEIHHFEKLLIPFSPAIPTNYTPDTYSWIIPSYIKWSLKNNPVPPSSHALYLSRNHVRPGSRSVFNENEVIEYLASMYNLKVINGSEPLADVVGKFFGASHIFGPHGSLFANTIFSGSHAKVIEYCPANRIDHSFERKYKAVRDYKHCIIQADDLFNISIPLDSLN